MKETILCQRPNHRVAGDALVARRALRRAVARSVIVVAMCAFASPFAVSAQATTTPSRRPLLLFGGEISRPLHETATVGTLIPLRPLEPGTDGFGGSYAHRGLVLEAALGAEGYGLAAGWGRRIKEPRGFAFVGEDIMATWFRTRSSSHSKTGNATYVGAEVGFTAAFLPMTRISLGAARRISGPEEVDRTIFTWGLGFHLGR